MSDIKQGDSILAFNPLSKKLIHNKVYKTEYIRDGYIGIRINNRMLLFSPKNFTKVIRKPIYPSETEYLLNRLNNI